MSRADDMWPSRVRPLAFLKVVFSMPIALA